MSSNWFHAFSIPGWGRYAPLETSEEASQDPMRVGDQDEQWLRWERRHDKDGRPTRTVLQALQLFTLVALGFSLGVICTIIYTHINVQNAGRPYGNGPSPVPNCEAFTQSHQWTHRNT